MISNEQTNSKTLNPQISSRFKKSLNKESLLSARRLHDLPDYVHSKLVNYLAASELLKLSQLCVQLRKIYPKFVYEQCYVSVEQNSPPKERFIGISAVMFYSPNACRWFPYEHVQVLAFSFHAYNYLVNQQWPYFHLPVYFPKLRHVIMENWPYTEELRNFEALAAAPNVFPFSHQERHKPTCFDQSIRFLDAGFRINPAYPNLDAFPNLTVFKFRVSDNDNSPEMFLLLKSLKHNTSIKYFHLFVELGPNFLKVIDSCPENVKCFSLTISVDGFGEIDFTNGKERELIKSPIKLEKVTHLTFTSSISEDFAGAFCQQFLKLFIVTPRKLTSLSLEHDLNPSFYLDCIDSRYEFLTRLSVQVPVRHNCHFEFSKLMGLSHLKHLNVTFCDDSDLTQPEIDFSQGHSLVQSFLAVVREKCWSPRAHTMNISKFTLNKLDSNPYFSHFSELLLGCLLGKTEEVMTNLFPIKGSTFEHLDELLVMRILYLRDIFRLSIILNSLEYLQVFSTENLLNNMSLLPLVYNHPTLKYLAFTDFIDYTNKKVKLDNFGIDKDFMFFRPTETSQMYFGMIDAEGMRQKYARKGLSFSQDANCFESCNKTFDFSDYLFFQSDNGSEFSVFEENLGLLSISDGTEEDENN